MPSDPLSDQAILSDAAWNSIVNAVRHGQLQEHLGQLTLPETLAALQESGLGTKSSAAQWTNTLEKVLGSSQELLQLQIVLAAAAIYADRDSFEIYEEKCDKRGVPVLRRIQQLVYKVPEVLIFLTRLDWRGLGSDRAAAMQFLSAVLEDRQQAEDCPPSLLLLFRLNGIPTEEDWKYLACHFPRPQVLDYLLEIYPDGILNYGMLQYAAAADDVDLVLKLIDAGADVNLDPPIYPWNDIRDMFLPLRPLNHIAIYARFRSRSNSMDTSLQIARILLEHGANVHLPSHGSLEQCDPRDSALQQARKTGIRELIELYEEYQDRASVRGDSHVQE